MGSLPGGGFAGKRQRYLSRPGPLRKTDLTALVAISAGDKEISRAWFWKPQDSIFDHEKRDRVPYTVWKKQGFIETTPGKAIQYDWVAERLGAIFAEFQVVGVAFDRWRIDDLLNALKRIGVEAWIDNGKERFRWPAGSGSSPGARGTPP